MIGVVAIHVFTKAELALDAEDRVLGLRLAIFYPGGREYSG
jgi:hypothetical protein